MTIVEFSVESAKSTKSFLEGLMTDVRVTIRDEFSQQREAAELMLSQQPAAWAAEDDRVDPVHCPKAIAIDIESVNGEPVNEQEVHEIMELFT